LNDAGNPVAIEIKFFGLQLLLLTSESSVEAFENNSWLKLAFGVPPGKARTAIF
jgi:hypothetical protein